MGAIELSEISIIGHDGPKDAQVDDGGGLKNEVGDSETGART